jgi:hypothetical protein
VYDRPGGQIAPQAEQAGAASGDVARYLAPRVFGHDETRPRPVAVDALALRDDVEE